jgi:tight adherence protein B
MTPIDVFTVCSFIGVILCGVMALVVMDMRSKHPNARIRTRMHESFAAQVTVGKSKVNLNSDFFTVDKTANVFSGWIRPKVSRLRTVAGANGIRSVIGAAIIGELVALLMTHYMPLPGFAKQLSGRTLSQALPQWFPGPAGYDRACGSRRRAGYACDRIGSRRMSRTSET